MNEFSLSEDFLTMEDVCKAFSGPEVRTVAVRNVDLSVRSGDYISIVGSSGSGKTSLLSVIGLMEAIDSGDYILGGKKIKTLGNYQRRLLRSQWFGYIFQNFHLIDTLTVYANVELALRYKDGWKSRERRDEAVRRTLERLNIAHRAKHYPFQLSGGQQQRVAIARASVSSPRIILADEPTGNLDSTAGLEVISLLEDLNSSGSTVILVTHDREIARRASSQLKMIDGRLESVVD